MACRHEDCECSHSETELCARLSHSKKKCKDMRDEGQRHEQQGECEEHDYRTPFHCRFGVKSEGVETMSEHMRGKIVNKQEHQIYIAKGKSKRSE